MLSVQIILQESLNSIQNVQSQHMVRPHAITSQVMRSTRVSSTLSVVRVPACVHFYIYPRIKLSFSSTRWWQVPR